ncbi:MAG TPA: hypothetical protein VH641_13545 [Streptosporangiaceae bacterium]
MPGQPEPVYPPGQFSAWNRPSVRAAWLGISRIGDGHGEPEAEPGYSLLATSDPSADSTATQTLAAIDDGSWPPARVRRDWGSHAEDAGPLATRRPGSGARPRGGDTVSGGAGRDVGPRAGGMAPGGPGGRRGTRADLGAAALGAAGVGAAALAAAGLDAAGQREPGESGTGPHSAGPHSADPRGTDLRGPDTRAAGTRSPAEPAGQQASGGPGSQRAAAGGAGVRAGRQAEARGEPAPSAAEAAGRQRAEDIAAGRTAPARRAKGHRRSNMMMAALLLSPVLVVVLVVVGYVYITGKRTAPSPHAAALPAQPLPTVSARPTPTLGPWKHIQNQTLDTLPLTLKELFPLRFTAGMAGTRTIDKASKKCTKAVIGSALEKAVHKAHCTQVLRASYLSGDRKLMATIGVLNLRNAKLAERAGKASGTHEFIRQLAAKHGPTRHLTKGTGLEEADVLGHYLILTWTEFANLHKPSGKKQLTELKKFSKDLITGTANISLSSRMVTGTPRIP